MKIFKKNYWLFAVLFALLLVGCKPKTVNENLFEDTYEKMSDLTNYKVEMTISKGFGENVDSTLMVFGFDLESKTKGVVKVDTTLLGIDHQGYREFNESEVLSYTNIPGTENWVKKTMTMDDFNSKDIDHDNYFSILTNLTTNEFVNEVTLEDGNNCKVYSLKLNDSKILDDLFTAAEQKTLYTLYGLSQEEFLNYFKELTYEVTIDSQNKLVRTIKVDLSDIFVQLATDYTTKTSKEPTVKYDDVSIQIVFSDFNDVEVSIPVEVKEIAIAR